MKYILLLSLLIAFNTQAAKNSWDKLQPGERYKLNQELNFQTNQKSFQIKKGTRLRLVESTPLNMIKVHLQRYEIDNCSVNELESDLELVNVAAAKQASVGINMSKGCILEVFVEKKDFKKQSLVL